MKRISRSSLVALVVVAGASLLWGCSGTSEKKDHLSLAMTTWVGYGPIFLARDLGYFEEQGLTVDLQRIEESSIYMAALAAGRLDGTATAMDAIMKYRTQDVCFKAVASLDESHGGDGIVTGVEVASLQDLRGKQIAINQGSTSEFWFNILIDQAGMKESDFRVVNMTSDGAAAAFIAGRVPAAVTWEPHLSLVREQGKGKVLIDSTATPGVIVDVLTLRCEVIEKRPEVVRKLVNGLFKAVDYLKSNPEEAYPLMARGVGGYLADPAVFADAARSVVFHDRARAIQYLADTQSGESRKLLEQGNRIWSSLGQMHMTVDYTDLIEPMFLED